MWARHAQPLYALRAGHPPNGIFFPLGYPFLYRPVKKGNEERAEKGGRKWGVGYEGRRRKK
jgi:hypothetical protein